MPCLPRSSPIIILEDYLKLNVAKSNYIIYTRTKEQFATRLHIGSPKLDQVSVTQILGLWVSEDLSWTKNCQEICRKPFSRLSMITKLKYVGVGTDDLLNIYILFIRSVTEYCAVAFHSSLTIEQSNKLEKIQKTCLRVILGELYTSYLDALALCGLQTLFARRQKRCLTFSLKCLKHPSNKKMFPLNPVTSDHYIRDRELFHVNFAKTSTYKKSAIPFCQRMLNDYFNTN